MPPYLIVWCGGLTIPYCGRFLHCSLLRGSKNLKTAPQPWQAIAFYLCNAVERPYYWFPYGFENDSDISVYHELYPNALREVSEGVNGYIYIGKAVGLVVLILHRILKGKAYDRNPGLFLCFVYKMDV